MKRNLIYYMYISVASGSRKVPGTYSSINISNNHRAVNVTIFCVHCHRATIAKTYPRIRRRGRCNAFLVIAYLDGCFREKLAVRRLHGRRGASAQAARSTRSVANGGHPRANSQLYCRTSHNRLRVIVFLLQLLF